MADMPWQFVSNDRGTDKQLGVLETLPYSRTHTIFSAILPSTSFPIFIVSEVRALAKSKRGVEYEITEMTKSVKVGYYCIDIFVCEPH